LNRFYFRDWVDAPIYCDADYTPGLGWYDQSNFDHLTSCNNDLRQLDGFCSSKVARKDLQVYDFSAMSKSSAGALVGGYLGTIFFSTGMIWAFSGRVGFIAQETKRQSTQKEIKSLFF